MTHTYKPKKSLKLFDDLSAGAFALVNPDEKRGAILVQNTKAKASSFALKGPADFTAKVLTNTLQGLELRIAGHQAWFQLAGAFNAYNLIAAYAAACLIGADSHAVLGCGGDPSFLLCPFLFLHVCCQ